MGTTQGDRAQEGRDGATEEGRGGQERPPQRKSMVKCKLKAESAVRGTEGEDEGGGGSGQGEVTDSEDGRHNTNFPRSRSGVEAAQTEGTVLL